MNSIPNNVMRCNEIDILLFELEKFVVHEGCVRR